MLNEDRIFKLELYVRI